MSQHMSMLTVLGSTGSIGVSTLDVVAQHPDRYQVFALAASTRVQELFVQVAKYRPRYAVMADAGAGKQLAQRCVSEGLNTQVLWGAGALEMVSSHEEVDAVMAAIVGAAGLAPCLAAARAGKRLLLANKEALVVGGQYFMDAVKAGGATLLPIDSEHSAIFQVLPQDQTVWSQYIDKIILTASGGPFRARSLDAFADISPDQACAHPNWVMGRKISVDSATMMNKGLEVIEAKHLFGIDASQIRVVIHPQSVIHSMVQFVDNSVLAQMGTPDMRVPIAYGLSWPERTASGAPPLDFSALSALTFEPADREDHQKRFPCLRLAWQALNGSLGTTAVLNAANEVAVEAFLSGELRFDRIFAVNEAALAHVMPSGVDGVEALMDLDARARQFAHQSVRMYAHCPPLALTD